MESAIMEKKADKDYDGDGKIESPEDEYKGSRDKAIKKAMDKNTNESVSDLSDSLRAKLSTFMEEKDVDINDLDNVESDLEKIDEEEKLDEDQEVDSEAVTEEEEVIEEEDQESLDEMAELLRMAGLGEGTASCSSMPRHSAPTTGPEQVNGYEGDFVGEEEEIEEAHPFGKESEAEMDDHAEKAGDEVAHDMEYDDDHNGSKDDHDEKEGDKVTKEIEFDDKEHEAMKSLLKKLLA